MSQQLWRLDPQSKAAVLEYKRTSRYVAELRRDLVDLCEIGWHSPNREQQTWARQQVASIRHELDEIEAGRLGAPEDWQG